jgi:predicted permease
MPEYSVPHEAVIHVNGAVVVFTFVISVLTGILFGMAPALQLAKRDLRDAMQESGRSLTGSTRTGKARGLLIISEVALTMVLLVGAGVAIRGFIALLQTRLGYDPTNVLSMWVNTREGQYKTWETRRIYFQRVLEKLRTTPGVVSAAATITATPPWIGFETGFDMAGHPENPNQQTRVGLISDDYFSTVHIPLLSGRIFSGAELERSAHLALINEEMLRQYWPNGQSPIGQKIRVPELRFEGNAFVVTPPNADPSLEIIGVVATARNRGLHDAPKPAIYIPYTLVLPPGCNFLVRTAGDPHKLIRALSEELRTVDPDQPVTQVMTLDESLSRFQRAYPRFSTTLFSIFATVGLLLAATGIYSVISYIVTRRTHEFGIRMALGARGGDVLRLIVTMVASLMFTGIAIGLVGSLALSRVVSNYVQGWDAKDPIAFLAVTAVLLSVAIVACLLPARRAATIQPMTALRHE